MTAPNDASTRIDAYLAGAPEAMRDALTKMRAVIRDAAPDAVEVFAYGMPGFKYRGRPLLYYAAAKKHYALYGHSQAVLDALSKDLQPFDVEKGTIRFPPDSALPEGLIAAIVRVRLGEIEAAEAAKKVSS